MFLNLNLNKKQIKILIIVFVIVVLIVLAFYIMLQRAQNVVIPIPKQEEVQEEPKIVTPQIENEVMPPKEITEESTIESISSNFAERLGSYSTDNKDENFISLNSYLTKEGKDFLSAYISSNEKLNGQDYYGVTSKALNANAVISGESASSVVSVQQVETSGIDLRSEVLYKKLNLDLIKQGDSWLVMSFNWESNE